MVVVISLYYIMVKKALLIGINYTSVPGATLRGCIDDVLNMKAMLIANYGYTENDIIVLRDDTTDPKFMPTASNIIGYLYTLIYYSSSFEELWIHYSGHGSQIINTRDKVRPKFEVIIPVDFMRVGVIPDYYLYNLVRNSKTRTMMLFDSCNSGTVCDLIWSFEYIRNNLFSRTQNNKLAISNPNIFMISGCKETQTSAEFYDTEDLDYEGVFTDSFLDTLKAFNYKGSIFDIYKRTCINIAAAGYSQKPILSSSSPNPSYKFGYVAKQVSMKNLVADTSKVIKETKSVRATASPTARAIAPTLAPVKRRIGMANIWSATTTARA